MKENKNNQLGVIRNNQSAQNHEKELNLQDYAIKAGNRPALLVK